MKEAAEDRTVASEGDFPLSPGQKALWFLDRLAPGNAAYVLAAAARVKKGLEPAALLSAVEALVERHPALRTTFGEGPDGPYQRVHERLAPEVIVSGEADVNEIAWRPFNLERGPLLRVALLGDTLVISVHHIVCDFWSAEVMSRDLGLLLSGADLPALPLRYTDHVRRAAERLAGPEGERLWSFWSRQLSQASGELPRLELPTDRPRPLVRTWAGGAVSSRVAPEAVERLHALSKGARTTFFTTLTAAFQAFLGRYTRQEDVLIGSPTAGRTHRTMAGVVGYFVNPVVLRGDLSGDPAFTELLARTKAMVLAAMEHRGFPFPVLAERLVPGRDPGRQPVFDVLFAFQRERSEAASGVGGFALGEGGEAAAVGALEIETLALEPPATDFDLSLMAAEMEGSLALSLRYSAELFDRATAGRMLEHLGRLLAGIAEAPERRLSDLPLLSAAEREELLVALNRTERERPRGVLLHEPFFTQAGRDPEAVAVVDGTERWTYFELAARAEALAARLRAAGVGPETPVGICLTRTPVLIASLLAVLRAGGLYVPLDPNYPKDRLAAILEDAGAPVLMTEERCLGVLPETRARPRRILRVDVEEEGVRTAPAPDLPGGVRDSRVAYLIYTSGSTGRPKGVAITHRSAAEMVAWSREVFPPGDLAGMLVSTSICFDISVFEIFVPLSSGGRLILADNALELPELPAKDEVTLINTVPSAMAELLRAQAVPASVRTVNLAGEPLRGALARRVLELPGVRLFNLYGPSEDTTYSTFAAVGPEGEPTIGVGLSNTRIYLVDPQLHLTPRGVPGELCIAGEGLARGYFGRPDLTAERFVPDPFTGEGERMYRTGDLARWRPDGELDFLGRIDFQVKVRGFRIEPGEIEALLLSHPGVREAVVTPREMTLGDLRLVAFVALKSEDALPGLRPYLRERLPEHMVPWAIVPLPALPLSPNGKVDRKALARVEVAREGVGEAAGAEGPRNATEELLARLWREVLGLPETTAVGIHDNFFTLGGHSLLATQLVSRLRETLGVELPLRQVFETPTVADLARALPGSADAGAGMRALGDTRGEAAPLSFAQERLWFLDRFEPGSAAYNMPAALRITGYLDVPALAAAFGEISRRHEVLRAGFPESGGRPVQKLIPWTPWTLPVEDLSALPEGEREATVESRVRQEATRLFDLTRPPLLRTVLLELSPREHVLVVVLHHIVADGWSIGVLLRELTALYGAYRKGQTSPLPPLPGQYADFAAWQREWLSGPVLEEQLAWWRRTLAGAPDTLDLPADRRRPSSQSYRGAHRLVAVPAGLAAELGVLARGLGATPFMVLLAAFDTLLARLSGQRDLVVGSPIANRNRLEIEPLIGCFVNTLALRADLSANPAFGGLVEQMREVTLGAYAHQDLPFERLVEELLPARDPSRTPLFQVVFALQNAPAGALALSGVEAEPLAVETGVAKFDLTLILEEAAGGGLSGFLEYATDLFEGATAERWAGHLLTLFQGIVAEPHRRISELPLLAAAEREELVRLRNRYGVAFPSPLPLHRRFEAAAVRAPQSVAVSVEGEETTYGDLDRWANRIARQLIGMGVEPGSRVGLFVHRSAAMVAGLLGILKAGAAYVPVDPDAPAERAGYVLADSGVKALVTETELSDRLDSVAVPRLLVDEEIEEAGAVHVEISEEAAAYVIYTSGSTGKPKGVVVSHANAARLFDATDAWFGFGPEDAWTLFHSIAFDFSVWELWGALVHGGRLVVVPYWVSRSPEAFLDLLARERVTVLNQTPSAFRQLVQADVERGRPVDLVLRYVVFGGEALELSSLAPWIERRGDERPRLINMYGITETTVHVTFRRITGEDVAAGRGSVIGEPIPDLQVYVLDSHLEPVPFLVGGEIHVGGAGLAHGYLGRPELTAERFVPDPFGGSPGSRLYRSGDLARRMPNGDLEYLGRIDQQVKIRGFRIELGEIEAALASHPEVQEAVVLARSFGGSTDTRLVAYIVAGERATAAALHGHLSAQLPAYMVPSAFVRLERFPLTVNGKLDRRALPEPEESRMRLEGDYQAPRTPVEETLARIWSELLGVDLVGIEDDFFALGGHSLLATQLVSRVRQALGVELPLRRFFEAPTIAAIAADLQSLRPVHRPSQPVARPGERSLSFAQERLWFLELFEPGTSLYNIPAALRFEGGLDVPALAAAFGEVVRRHEVLRSALMESESRWPVQKVQPWTPWELPLADLSGLPEALREVEWRRLANEEGARPFDLTRPPMLRTLLMRLDEREHALALAFHHVAADGWSIGIFLRELAALYRACSLGQPSPLPELPLQYADFAAWQRQWLSGPVLEEQLAWWRQALAGAPGALDLPADHPRPAVLSHRGRQLATAFPAGLSAEVLELARHLGATPFMVLLTAFQTLLARVSGQEDVVAGSPIANRNRLETEGLIGFFVNSLALRLDLSGNPTFEEAVRRTREVTLGAYAHQDLPFEKLVGELVPARDPSRTPIFQVLFALQNTPMGSLELPGLKIQAERVDTGTAKFDLSLLLDESADGFSGFVEYATDLFDGATVARLMGHLQTLLAGIVAGAAAGPRTPVWELPVLTGREREQVLAGFNRTELEHPRDPLLHELILAQVERTPDAVALVYGKERLTYREIAERSARMAARLRAAGVGPEVPVGICLNRTPALLVSMLGVLRAGGFYVPLDPNYPSERLAAILDDSRAPVLVTEVRCLPVLPDTEARIVMADFEESVEAPPVPGLTGEVRALQLAYTIYTSGSTGRPKGVAITHRNVVALTYWSREVYSDEEFAGVLGSTSICFDMSIFELFVTLAWGGTVILAENALELPELPAKDEVALINTVPSAMSELVRLGAVPPSVRTVNLGGEPLRGALARRIHELGTIRLYNVYGPSEDTTFTTWADVGPVGEPTIGRPLANTRIYVLDRNLNPVPVGVPGEVYISGEGVTRGYLGRPDMTAEKYLPDPFREDGARMYRVGDLGRWRADSELEYLGRIDHQVKIRGFRVELGDIEAALLSHPAVREAVVVTREPVPGDLRLAAFAVPKPGELVTDLRDHLKARLPEYMVPWAIVPLGELPLLPNGKVNRRALTSMELGMGREAGARDGARTPVEELIAGLWREVLALPEEDEVGVHDNFFSLGGHSLLATQLISRLRETVGVELPLRGFFENPTVAGLAGLLPALGGTEAPPIRPVPRWQELPLSFAQERLWFVDRFEPGSTMYNITAAARLRGELDVPAATAAIGEIVRRHEVLRTGFAEEDGRPVQVLSPWTSLKLPLADLSGLPEGGRDAEVRRILEEDAAQPFDLGRPPLLRPSLLRLGADEHVLMLDFHHIASDGWSIGVFLRELTLLYDAAVSGRPSPLPPLAVQYADFAHWQREWMRGDVLLGQLDYWGRALAGAPPVLDLATDRPRETARNRRAAERRFVLPAPLVAELTRLGQSAGATLFSVLTAGLQALLSRLSGQEDLVVGSPIANRNRLETEPLIGFFVNVLALRLDLSGNPIFLDLVHRARETALGAYSHQDLPFEKLVELLATGRDLDSTPIFQVLFALQNTLWSGPRLGELSVETLPVPSRDAKFLLNLVLIPEEDGVLAGTLEYRAGLFDAATMDRLAARFTALLEAVAAGPAARLSDLPLLTSEEEVQTAREWGLRLPEPVLVLGKDGQPVPPGVPGSLFFVEPDGGLRPAGARARWLAGGDLEMLESPSPEEALGSERERAAHETPRTEVEELLAGIWKELLGVDSVGLHDDFFALGGHSLLATRLLSHVRSALGVDLPVRRLFEASTLEAQAAALEAARADLEKAQPVREPAIQPLHQTGPLPLSFAQQRLWFLEQFEPGNPTYNIAAAVRLTGPLDAAALESALAGVVARHDALRSRFEAVEGEPAVVADPEVTLRLETVDVPDEARATALAREEALRPFDLATGPLVRARLLKLSEADHVLLLTMHHIVSDGWSMGILVREVAALYEGSELPELPIQYADFAAWQRRWLEGEALSAEIAWWQQRLAGAPAALELPTDRPRPLVKTSRGGLRRTVLPAALAARLRETGRRTGGATLFMTLLAGLAVLLHRWSRQEDVLVGSPIANRNRAEIEPLIGFFVNTLVLRADVSGDPSFTALLARVRDAAMAAYDHQDLPFEKVVEAVRPDRDLARSPLFQVAFALQNLPIPELRLGDLVLAPVPTDGGTVKFDWDVAMEEIPGSGEIQVRWAYNADLFDPATAERALGQLRTLLEAAVEMPDARVSELPLLSAAERHALDAEWIAPDEYPSEILVHEAIAAQAARRPEAAALLLDGEALTYGELDLRANRLANLLCRKGIGPESLVGVCLDRSFDLVVSLLAILKSGAAYLPLDPNYPRERLRFMLSDSGVEVLVAREVLIGEILEGVELKTIAVDADRELIDAQSGRTPAVGSKEADPDNPAYVIYTSGSTGVPKGVVVSHRALSNRLGWAAVYDVHEGDTVLQKTSVSFDVSVFEVFGPLMVGAREVLVRAETQRDVDGLLRLIGEHGVTIASFPPSLLYVLMERDGFDAACRTLRMVVTGGEVVPADLPGRLLARLGPDARLFNRYGPTEATVSVTSWTCRRGVEERVLPIGRPIAGAEVYVLGPALSPVPVGVPGEILLGGLSLARGYLARPALTAERFVPHPFSARPGERLYRTGDLARFRPDGAVEFVGRVDSQVKIRGFRVELGEVEAVLARHPGVREVAVIDREESAAGQGTATRVLVAYFVPDADQQVPEGSLRELARAELPAHMVPSAFVQLERLPLGPTGKVDRRSLPAPASPERAQTAPEAPRTGLEERIAAVWREVLEVERVGLNENFFDLGGHSLLMARVHGRLQKELGRKISMVELFQYPTVATLAAHLGGEVQGRPVRRRTVSPGASKIAIVGLAGRFPKAADADQLWRNFCSGVEAISSFSDEELLAQGIEPALLADPRYVRAAGVLDGADLFDADFFGFSPREAELTDPQHRVFLECAWEALESAGYASDTPGSVGVYAGTSFSGYLGHLAAQGALADAGNPLMGNDKDFLATRVSYKLNLLGPSLTVQTACSTSLVAVHLACQALLAGECDMALAGGVSIAVPLKGGYVYKEGAIHSPDGRCRAFDAEAAGTPRGAGSGVVVLKRLEDALADGDTVHAVILGSAVNNDGSGKVGFTAPSVDGQAAVIAEAQAAAGIDPATVGYVEAHGTGTRRGDPIELAALAQAFGATESRCAVVSSKPNIGHLDAAAGVASLIKATLAVREGLVPPTLNFERLNPDVELEGTPFFVNTELRNWPIEQGPRRAGVSSFGIGGTNAHLVLEEPPAPGPGDPSQPWQLLLLSARTEAALEAATERLARYLEDHPDIDLADVAYTLRAGRRAFPYRRMAVCRDVGDAIQALRDPRRIVSGMASEAPGEPPTPVADLKDRLHSLGRFWLAGGQPDWDGVQTGERRRRIPLPAYPFERRRYWVDARQAGPARRPDPADWTYVPGWKRTPPPMPPAANGERHQGLVFLDGDGLGLALAARLEAQGWAIETVSREDDFGTRLAELVGRGWHPHSIVHLWQDAESLNRLAQLLELARNPETIDITVVTDGVQDVMGGEASHPEKAQVLGPCRSLAQANRCRWVDVDRKGDAADLLAAEVTAALPDLLVAHRGGHRWVRTYEPVKLSRRLNTEAVTVRTSDGPRAVLDAISSSSSAFVVLSSTLAPVVGGDAGEVSMGAFAGALAEQARKGGPRVLAVDWDPDVKPEEAADLLPRLLASGLPRIVVSTRDLDALLRAGEAKPEAAARQARTVHPRPNLSTPYVAPRSELETQVAGLWGELLGIEGVGIDDNFFESGGHSLLATQLISQVRDRFGVEVKFARFFDAPTVSGLAAAIVGQAAAVEEAALAELLAEIQGLSAEDLQDQLAAEKQSLLEDGSS